MRHERCRLNPNQIQRHLESVGRLAINTALTIKHEVVPPKPEAPIVERPTFVERPTDSELVILDDETAVIKPQGEV